jgi:antitoxin MazE
MTQATLGRWGKSLAVRLPTELAAAFSLREGDHLEIESDHDRITIRPAKPQYTLDEMFAGKSREEWRALYAGAYDWGPEVGREVIDE